MVLALGPLLDVSRRFRLTMLAGRFEMTLAMMQHVNPDLELGEPLLEAGHQLCIVSPICAGLDSAETQMM